MKNKQTALEWFTNEITLFGSIKIDSSGKEFIQFNYSLYHKVLLEAKQIEKEQITNKTNTNTNTQTKTTWWTETKLWIVSSTFFITFLTLAYFYPMIALAICGLALGAVFLYMLVWLGTILLKDALGLDDDE